jgi:hypothetical protein
MVDPSPVTLQDNVSDVCNVQPLALTNTPPLDILPCPARLSSDNLIAPAHPPTPPPEPLNLPPVPTSPTIANDIMNNVMESLPNPDCIALWCSRVSSPYFWAYFICTSNVLPGSLFDSMTPIEQDARETDASCRMGRPHSHLQRMRERHAGELSWLPPGISTPDLPAAGGGQRATQSASGCDVQGRPRMWEPKVPVSTVQGDGDKWMDDVETFQGPTPPQLCGCSEGRKMPAVPVLRDANEPVVPDTHQHKGVPGGEGKTTPAGHGSQVSTCFATAIHGARGRIGTGQGVPIPRPSAIAGQ